MAVTTLPTIPFVVFGVIEPALLTTAWISALNGPQAYFTAQIPSPSPSTTSVPFPPQALALSLMLANIFLLLALLALVCTFTLDARVSRGYLLAVAIADWGHIWAAYKAMGPDVFWDLKGWNDMAWGNVGVSVVLNVLRLATVLGAFGAWGKDGRRKGMAEGKKAR